MIKYYCKECGKVVAFMEEGSKLHKDIVMLCGSCYYPNFKKTNRTDDPDVVKNLMSMFGMKNP